ncbi:MAG TPA: HAD family hydrolase [Acidimicrobiales bacterium]|jgi:HAD superfamily hydrolase (TIGR01509 family)|nr:HAD family hydrolase [Acidimicrobiales bacterium]
MEGVAADAVVVDLDGTVWDSAPWYEALAVASGNIPPQGLTAARLLKAVGFTHKRFSTACASGAPPLHVYPGITAALRRVSRYGVALGVVTNLPGWMAKPMLAAAGLAELLPQVVDYGATTRRKPNPDPLLEVCRRLGCRPQDAWYVGDSPDDAQAAIAAGMCFAWASWGYAPEAPVGAHRVLDRPEDIGGLLQERR